MLAGCSSTLLSPRQRLRSEASAQFQACHLPSMNTQRLDLPCSFARKESSRLQSLRPVGLSVEKSSIEAKTTSCCSLKHSTTNAQMTFKDELWDKGKSLKRFADHGSFDDESCMNRAKRKRGIGNSDDSLNSIWFQPNFQVPFSLSEEEERVCFVPSDVISPPLPLSNNPNWVESIVTEITELGDKNVDTSGHRPVKEASGGGSSTSSENPSLALNLITEKASEHEAGNGSNSRLPNPNEGAAEMLAGNHGDHHDGFELISLLMAFVEAIGSKNIADINHLIARLGDLASPRGSPISRLSAYFTEALALRVARLWPHFFHITTPRELDRVDDDNGGTALRLLNQVSPIPKFIHFTSNELLLRAFEGKERVHIIDFDIKQGLQWPSLFQSLASRSNPPTHVRITGVGESKQELIETGDRLAGFAEALNLPFEFHPVVDRLEDVRLWMLHVKERESVAVNCIFQLHKMLYDGNGGALRDFLGLIRSTNPTVVLMAEQEANHNDDPSLETRLCTCLKYYSAIFDSVDSTSLPLDSPVRIKIEEMFAREIRNIIACEGRDRLERHESFEKWRKLMEEQGGFQSMGISERELIQSQMLLKMYSYSCDKYRVEKQGQDGAALTLSWSDQPLYTVSAWKPIDVAGSSLS